VGITIPQKRDVFINSVSAVSCAGNTIEKTFEAILSGKSGISKNDNYHDADVSIGLLDTAKSFDEHLKNAFAALNLPHDDVRTFLLVGSSVGGMFTTENLAISNELKKFDAQKHAISSITDVLLALYPFVDGISFSTACTSSANALIFGSELIKSGAYDRVVVVGADSISRTTVQGFHALGVLSANACKPFDTDRDGMNVAEGIAMLCLESAKKEKSVRILGYGATSDAHNITHPHPEGLGARAAIQKALTMSCIGASEVTYINAHGTATKANDEAEGLAISALFDKETKTGSTKSITGHTLGAAGALEAAITVTAMRNGVIPKNTFLSKPENELLSLPTENENAKIKYAISNSIAFGGNNASILFGVAF
jgi:3-oxoacyl-[acyl-carrier-protein] synthase I